jgi:hypothetical protein
MFTSYIFMLVCLWLEIYVVFSYSVPEIMQSANSLRPLIGELRVLQVIKSNLVASKVHQKEQ